MQYRDIITIKFTAWCTCAHIIVLSSKGSADITLSEDIDQITEKVIEETPTVC